MIRRSLVSGTIAAAAVTLAASLAARRATGSSAAALNATSHLLWGERASRQDGYSLKYTAEALGRGKRRSRARALIDGALVSAAAYVTDYHLVPRRLTPGFELRIPRAALALVYAALALGLSARDLKRWRFLIS